MTTRRKHQLEIIAIWGGIPFAWAVLLAVLAWRFVS
jgi:hypothetical protein